MDRAKQNLAPRFAAAAENLEAYQPAQLRLQDSQGQALAPSPSVRTPCDQIIANTVNGILRPRPVFSFDAYFAAEYQVLIPVQVSELRISGLPVDPSVPDDAQVGAPLTVDAERVSRRFEQGVDFCLRERMDFPYHLHRAVYLAVAGSPPYWKTWYEPKPHTYIGIKKQSGFVDTNDVEERYSENGCIHFAIVPFQNVLRPNIDDDMDDLEWYAERLKPWTPDMLTEKYENGELFLIKDAETAKVFATTTVTNPKDESEQRTDSTIRKYDPTPASVGTCDVWEVPFDAYLKIVDPDDLEAKPKVRKFSLVGNYHYGQRKFMSIIRNPYNHQRRWLVPITQFIDGSSTVDVLKPAQQLLTQIAQSELKSGFLANNPIGGYDPHSTDTAAFMSELRDKPLPHPLIVPGVAGKDFSFSQAGFQHESLVPLWDRIEAATQNASRITDYDAGNRVVSHTSPSTVAQMLERGGQPQVLFLRLLDRALRKVVRLYLEVSRQFKPLGEDIPVRDPETKQIVNVPFYYPIGDVLDNFQITTTAASEAIARERDVEQQLMIGQANRDHMANAVQIATAIIDPKMQQIDPKVASALIDLFRRALESSQALFDRIIGPIRTDEEKFDALGPVESLIELQKAAIQQAVLAAQMGAVNVQNPTANAGGNVQPSAEGTNPAGPVGAGAQPGMAEGAPVAPDEIPPAPI
jgi:hypothetical protein